MKRNKFFLLAFTPLLLYGISLFFQDILIGKIIFSLAGIFLVLLQGYLLQRVLKLENFGLIFIIPLSFLVLTFGAIFSTRLFGVSSSFAPPLCLVGENIVLLIANMFFREKENYELIFEPKLVFWAAVPVILFLLCFWIYPYFVGDDTYVLATSLRESIQANQIIQPFSDRRPFFTPLVVFLKTALGLSIKNILIFVLPLGAILSFMSPLAILKKQITKNWWLGIWSVVFLASPYLFFQLQYAIPQSLVLIFTYPVLMLLTLAVKEQNYIFFSTAFLFSALSLGFHELGAILLACSFIAFITMIFRSAKTDWRKTLKGLFVAAIIIFPYLLIFHVFSKFKAISFIPKFLINNLPTKFHFEWWYVDYYLNPDGIVFSYPGIMGIFWYLFLGALVVFLFVLALPFLKKKISWLNFSNNLPLIFYLLILFFVAEIYPRFAKVAFLPERAWPFLAAGLSLLSVLLVSHCVKQKINFKAIKILSAACLISVLAGCGGSIYLTTNRGLLLSREEAGAIQYINQQTPADAVLVSTQSYNENIAAFSDRVFVTLSRKKYDNLNNLLGDRKKEIEEANKNQIAVEHKIIYKANGEVASDTKKDIGYNEYNLNKIYFVYSIHRFEKTKFVGNSNYFAKNDIENKALFENPVSQPNGDLVYNKNGVIIFKLK